MNKEKRVGILGGTFNPIHIGHLMLAERALEEYDLDKILFIPTGRPYFKSEDEVLDKNIRVAMTGLAIEDEPRFVLSTIEADREGNSYTYETLKHLKKDEPDTRYYLILGADTLFQIDKWLNPESIMADAGILAAVRDDKDDKDLKKRAEELIDRYDTEVHILKMPHIDISSSDIRDRIRSGLSVRDMVPDKILEYIEKNGLYRDRQSEMTDLDNKEILKNIYLSLDEHKAEDIKVIDITDISIMADYFVIASAGNQNHVHALCDYLEEDMRKVGVHYTHVEGYDTANWVLMDYGDIIVHVFDTASREFYDLEHIWHDGKVIENI